MNRIYFNQADSRWATHPYPGASYPKATIKSGGCGPTSAAMIISSLRKYITPDKMGDIFRENGLRYATGTAPKAFEWIAEKWNLKVKKTLYIADAVECLKQGGMCVAYCKAGGLFSTGGHIIVLSEIRNNNLIVYDPYLYSNKFKNGNRKCVSINGNEAIVSVDNFKKYCNYTLYCYQATEVKREKHTVGESVIVSSVYNNQDDFVESAIILTEFKRGVIAYVQPGARQPYLIQLDDGQFWINDGDIRDEIKDISSSTVGQIKKLKQASIIYSNSNLSGSKYNYKANTSIKILANVNNNVDRIKVLQTGRTGYIKNSLYK